MKNRSYPIDAVITWVDGNDKQHKAKRMKYGNSAMFKAEDVAGSTRFTSVGEIFYCVASIHRFAPWINKIYIVTDGQDPHVKSFIEKNFSRQIPIEIVDHKTIFKGYEEFLPTFNSISIESLTWRIPGLSEHYIEFNDDFMLVLGIQSVSVEGSTTPVFTSTASCFIGTFDFYRQILAV